MAGLKQTIIRGGLESLYFTGAHWALKPFVGGIGVILTLHHVRPPRPDRFQPNRLLEVTPQFLAGVVKYLRRSGLEPVSLDEMHRRMTERDFKRRFVCITFDDGYRDTMKWAYPILKAAAVPFAVYVPTSFPDRLGELWWLVLEAVIAKRDRLGLVIDGENRSFDCATVAEKRALYDELYWWLRAAHLAQRRISATPLRARAVVRVGYRDVEWLPPPRGGLISLFPDAVQRVSGAPQIRDRRLHRVSCDPGSAAHHFRAALRPGYRGTLAPWLSAHPRDDRNGRQAPAKPGDHVVGNGHDGVLADGGHLRQRHGDERPHDDEDQERDGADEFTQTRGHDEQHTRHCERQRSNPASCCDILDCFVALLSQ